MSKFKKIAVILCTAVLASSLCGCAAIESGINDLKGDLIGNGYKIYTYDNYGEQTLETTGDKINVKGNRVKVPTVTDSGWGYSKELSSVITITIDGKEIESCGDTCIFEGDGLSRDVNFDTKTIESYTDGSLEDNTLLAYELNKFRNLFGKSRIVVIKSQMGQPICAYSGDEVYWEIPDNLPKMTKLMVDGKPLYIHRANFQIIDKSLLN